MLPGVRVAGLLVAAATGEAVLFDGGFSPTSRVLFAALAGAALVAALARGPRYVAAAARAPVVAMLAALAVVGGASTAWTVGLPGDAARWALVAAGYAALVVAAAALARERAAATPALALLVCVLAAASGVVGLVAVAAHGGPFADRVGGAWRPGGTLEYSPALALLEVSALPGLLSAMCSLRCALRLAGAAGAAVAAAVLALAASRTGLALAAIVGAAAIAAPARTVRVPRRTALAALGVVLAVALAVQASAPGSDGSQRVAAASRAPAAAAASTAPRAAAHTTAPDGGFWHGRLALWRAAAETVADRPLAGAGADAFLAASARHQRAGPVRFAHDLPLELAAELGVAGAVLAVGLYAAATAAAWRARATQAAWLLCPAALGFLASSLLDWPWHLAGSGAVWAVAVGGLVGSASGRAGSVPAPEPTS